MYKNTLFQTYSHQIFKKFVASFDILTLSEQNVWINLWNFVLKINYGWSYSHISIQIWNIVFWHWERLFWDMRIIMIFVCSSFYYCTKEKQFYCNYLCDLVFVLHVIRLQSNHNIIGSLVVLDHQSFMLLYIKIKNQASFVSQHRHSPYLFIVFFLIITFKMYTINEIDFRF